jgi:hypothetical protein
VSRPSCLSGGDIAGARLLLRWDRRSVAEAPIRLATRHRDQDLERGRAPQRARGRDHRRLSVSARRAPVGAQHQLRLQSKHATPKRRRWPRRYHAIVE